MIIFISYTHVFLILTYPCYLIDSLVRTDNFPGAGWTLEVSVCLSFVALSFLCESERQTLAQWRLTVLMCKACDVLRGADSLYIWLFKYIVIFLTLFKVRSNTHVWARAKAVFIIYLARSLNYLWKNVRLCIFMCLPKGSALIWFTLTKDAGMRTATRRARAPSKE